MSWMAITTVAILHAYGTVSFQTFDAVDVRKPDGIILVDEVWLKKIFG